MISDNDTLFESENEETIPEEEKTVLETDNTVPEGEETILERGNTMYAATFYDAMMQGTGDSVLENISIKKGITILGTYTVESNRIDGGMGSVWRVHHKYWNTDLAMKRPKPQFFSTEKSKDDFVKECETWIKLGLHPNIVSCYYVREISGVPSIFAEWMDGGSLEDNIRSGKLYRGNETEIQERILDIAIQAARGLYYAHEKNIIHRDVKPDNILLTKEGEVKISDFGISKTRGFSTKYCSMEQIRRKELSRKTDLYSWAVSLLEMYVGGCIWANGVVAGIDCNEYFEHAKISIPKDMKDLMTQCFDKEPEKRPFNFKEIEDRLKKIYRTCIGKPYYRPTLKVITENAEILNNRALSYLDLGKIIEAEKMLLDSSYLTWDGPNLALYNYWLLKNGLDYDVWEKHDCFPDDNDVLYCLYHNDFNQKYEKIWKGWSENYPELIVPFVSEIEDKIINAPSEEYKYFESSKVGWIYPSGSEILLVDEKSEKLIMISTETEKTLLVFDDPEDKTIKEPLYVCASEDSRFVYVIDGYFDEEKYHYYLDNEDIEESYSEEILDHYLLHIWDNQGKYLKTLIGPKLIKSYAKKPIAVIYQKGRYLICWGGRNNAWFWDLYSEKCYEINLWGRDINNEDVFSYTDLENGDKYLSSVDRVYVSEYLEMIYISDIYEAIQYGYGLLEEAPDICRDLLWQEEDRRDGLERLRKNKKAYFKDKEWTETICENKIPDTDLWWRVEKRQEEGNFEICCMIMESDGFVLWEKQGFEISSNDTKTKILISGHNGLRSQQECLVMISFEQLPKRFRNPYLISKVRSLDKYIEEDDEFMLLEKEMNQMIRDKDIKGAIELLKRAREYRNKGYLFRIAALSARIGAIGIPKEVNERIVLSKNEVFATLIENEENIKYIGNYCFKCTKTSQKLGNVEEYPFIDRKKGMYVDCGNVFSDDFTKIEIYTTENDVNITTYIISGTIKWIFALKDNKTLVIVADDSVYLPIKPIYRRVKGYIPSVNEKNREKYSYFLCNTEKVMTRYKLYQIDVESNECKIIGKGMGRYNLRLGCMEAHDMFYNGSISFMDEFEIIVNDQKKNMIGTEVIFKSKKEDFDLRKNMSTDICISDDGMFLIMCPCLTYDNNRPELYLLDWDWKTEIRTEKMLPVELHYDIKEYKKFVKKHLHVSFLKNKKVSFYLK